MIQNPTQPIVARGRGAREITVNEIAAPVSVTEILGGNVELLLALEAPVEYFKAVRHAILRGKPRFSRRLREIVHRSYKPVAVPFAMNGSSDL